MTTLPNSRIPSPREAPPLRWGIMAPGGIANSFADALTAQTGQRLVACGSRSAERAEEFARRWGIERAHGSYEALVADDGVDAVYVASPHSEHRTLALLAIEAGKHVLVEKPFTRNAAEAREVVDAARAAGVACLEAMWTRFLPRTDIVRQVLADGVLGELEVVMADHGQKPPMDPKGRMYNPELAGGALLDLGVYPVSYAHFVLGTPGRVTARGTLTDTGVDRTVSAVFDDYPDAGAQALVSTTLAARTPVTASISGTEGRVELDGRFYAPGSVRLMVGDDVVESGPPEIVDHGLCFQAAHFATMVAEGRTESEMLPLDETVAIMGVLDDIRRQVGVRYPGESEG